MLYINRKIGETVVISDDIEVTVIDVYHRGEVKLGFTSPEKGTVFRKEVHDRIQAEKTERDATVRHHSSKEG